MNVQYLIQLLNNKLTILANAKVQAYVAGDLPTINSLDQEILDTQNTLAQLTLVQQLANEAIASNTTTAAIVANGIANNQVADIIPDDPAAVLASYNMAIYAADPLYIQKLTDILENMPAMDTTQQIDAYIAEESIGSPLSGAMILGAAQQYNIDTRLLCAILELESNFGTAGVAVGTLNPGNVGNTGSATRTYNSWADGVAAVAQWLSVNPAISAPVTDTVAPTTVDTAPTVQASTTPMDPNAYTPSPSTMATSTSSNATSTSPISTIVPAASSTPDTSITGTSTPSIAATSTPDVSADASSTSPTATSTASTTLPTDSTVASSTPSSSTASSTDATSTDATTTLPTGFIDPNAATSTAATSSLDTSADASSTSATSTPSVNASTTQARRIMVGKRRKV